MGTIFVAEDPLIGRSVAIKSLRLDPGSSAADRDRLQGRFERETRIAGTFSHPNIVTIFDVGRQDGQPFIVMEFVEGESLRERLDEERRLPAPEVARLIRPIAEALDYAHERGVVHRDLKPSNVMLAEGSGSASVPKITDFGVAHLAGSDLTMSGKVFGAPSYMSPEQIRDEELAGESDQFAMAVIAYEMLTGRRPFAGAAAAQTIYQVVHNEPRDPRKLNPEVPSAAARVILRALDKDPSNRYPTCSAFAEALCQALEAPDSLDEPAGPEPARHRPAGVDAGSSPAGGRSRLDTVRSRPEAWLERLRASPGLALAVGVWLVVLLVVLGLAFDAGTFTGDPATAATPPAPDGRATKPAGSAVREGAAADPVAASTAAGNAQPEPGAGPSVHIPGTIVAKLPDSTADSEGPARTDDPEEAARPAGPALPHQLTVASRPAGARVFLDGRPLEGASPVAIRLTGGDSHLLRLEREGYEPVAWRFRVEDLDERHLSSGRLFFPLTPTVEPTGPPPDGVAAGPPEEPATAVEPVAGPIAESGLEFEPPVAPEEVRRVRAPADVETPRKIHHVPVRLPAGSQDVSGVVVVELEINRRGDVVQARLLSSLQPAVDRAVLDAVVHWKFAPTRLAGAPVNVLMTTTVRVGSASADD